MKNQYNRSSIPVAWLMGCLVTLLSGSLWAQSASVSGVIRDAQTAEALPFVNILINQGQGRTAGENGQFEVRLSPGAYTLIFSSVGYQKHTEKISLKDGQSLQLQVRLQPMVLQLEQTVVSAGRYQQKLSELTVSMEILKPSLIENTNTVSLEQAIERLPGVDIIDGQANIRNGSGWSYGAGSRVLVMVDDIPMLAADAGDAKWNYLPVEEIEQVEILKGASSALYGSAALNGVINVRTAWPGATPVTRIVATTGFYDQPRRDAWSWDKQPRILGGGSFYHARRMGNMDLVLSGHAFNDPGYRENNYEGRYRAGLKWRYRDPKVKGLTYSLNTGFMYSNILDFLLWKDADSGALRQNPGSITHNNGRRLHVDPAILYYSPSGARHQLKGRYFLTRNIFPYDVAKDNEAQWHFMEYQYYRKILPSLDFNFGTSGSYTRSNAALFGDHTASQFAVFAQADKHWGRLSSSLGARWERNQLDDAKAESRPVFRAGVNYKLLEYTFLRASFGQGYRYPSIAEKHTLTSVSGLNIFPNPRITSEYGWSAEAGLKQGLKLGEWEGFIDLAAFYTQYEDMMEFFFGFYDTLTFLPITENFTLKNMGFQARNIGRARISGFEVVLAGKGQVFNIPLTLMLGYTYTYPIDLNTDSTYRAGKAEENNILKYRYFHTIKADIQLNPGRFSMGMGLRFNSFISNVDRVFVDPFLGELILPGYRTYREENNGKPNISLDIRAAYKVGAFVRIGLNANNITNNENIGRPGDVLAPRQFMLRCEVNF